MNLIERAGWNIRRRQNSCYKEYNLTLAYFSFCFFIIHSIVNSVPCYLHFLRWQWNKRQLTVLLQFPRMFSIFYKRNYERNSALCSFLLNICQATRKAGVLRAESCKLRNIWCKTHTPLWFLIGWIIFLTHEKTLFVILIGLTLCIYRFFFHVWQMSFAPLIG